MLGEHNTGWLRLVRGLVLGMCVLAISVAGHAAGGQGSLPDIVSLLVLLPIAIALSVTLTDRRRGVAWLLGYLLAVQALFHVLLTLSTGHAGAHQGFTPTMSMLALHLLATLASAVVLTRGDAHLVAWLRFLNSLGRSYAVEVWTPKWVTVAVAIADQAPRMRRVATQPWQHRGPPALSI